MKALPVFSILFFLLFFTGIAEAGTSITLSPEPGHDNQDQINEALKNYDTVFLEAGVYEISGKIVINSGNTLTGSEDAIIRVWSGSSLWFIYNIGIITGNGCSNVEISNIQIDGNCDELPASYANFAFKGGSGVHNTQKAISISGYSDPEKGFISNIWIYNVKIYDCFSDGIRVAYADFVFIYDNFISNCQHEGFYGICIRYGLIQNNIIEGITSDCVRLDNGQNCIIRYNILDSYTGDNNNGAYKEGHQGIQAGDQGRSFNSGSTQPLKTTNIEIYENIFTGKKRMNVWIDASGKGYENIYVHDNDFQQGEALETEGTPVDFDFENIPSEKMVYPDHRKEAKTSNNLSDIFAVPDLTETGYIDQGRLKAINPEWQKSGIAEAYIYLAGFEGKITIDNTSYIPEKPSECAIVLTNTRNLADRPTGQTTTLNLYDGPDNSLLAVLEVESFYEVKAYKKITILGQSVKVPYWKEKSKNSTFSQTFDAPDIFPAVKPPKCYVKHYNGSHAIVIIPDAPGIVKTETFLNGSSAREYRLIGEIGTAANGFRSTRFISVSTWKFVGPQMSLGSTGLHIKEPFDIHDLKIEITTPYKTMEATDIEYIVIEDTSSKIFNLGTLTLLVLIFVYGRPIYKISKREFKKWLKNI